MKSFASIARASAAGLLCSSIALVVASSARADILPSDVPTVTPSGLNFNWTYNILVTSAQKVVTGDFFTIYDFAGYTGVTVQPAGFTPSAIGFSPPVVSAIGSFSPNDNPMLPNVTFTYSGPTINGPTITPLIFTLESQFDGSGVVVSFAGRGTVQSSGATNNLKNANFTTTLAPADGGRPGDVPEPGAYAFGVIAAGAVLGLMARKRKA